MTNTEHMTILLTFVLAGCDNSRSEVEHLVCPPPDPRFIYEGGLWDCYNAELIQCNEQGQVELKTKDGNTMVLLDGIEAGPKTTDLMRTYISSLSGTTVYVEQFRGLEGLRPPSRLSDIWYVDTKSNSWKLLNVDVIQKGLAKHAETLPIHVASDLYIVRVESEQRARKAEVGIWKPPNN